MEGIDWTLLQSFLAVVDAGSLRAAAAKTGATEPTLSRHIRDFEARVGTTLFVRTARGLDPTDAAIRLVDDARAMGLAAEALALKIHGRSQKLSGTVRITASVVVANLVLPSILTELRQAEPDIQIQLVASDQTQNLLRRDADIAIRMVDPVQAPLLARQIGHTKIGMFGSQSYLNRRGRPQKTEDLLTHDLLGYDRSDEIVRGLASNGLKVSHDNFVIRCDDKLVSWHLLLAGAGLGFAQTLLARRHPDLEAVDVGLNVPRLPIWLVMHEDVRTNIRIRRVADFLYGAIQQILNA
jgi:DNA-binding transcriptional LysR family regulator